MLGIFLDCLHVVEIFLRLRLGLSHLWIKTGFLILELALVAVFGPVPVVLTSVPEGHFPSLLNCHAQFLVLFLSSVLQTSAYVSAMLRQRPKSISLYINGFIFLMKIWRQHEKFTSNVGGSQIHSLEYSEI